jgi:hypothetical protein
MKRLAILSILAALVTSGCAVQRSMDASKAQTKLIGMTKFEFLKCAGEPWQTRSFGSTESLLYINEEKIKKGDSVPDKVLHAVTTEIKGQYCEARITINDGRVSGIRYSGQTGGTLTEGEACAPIIQGCL